MRTTRENAANRGKRQEGLNDNENAGDRKEFSLNDKKVTN